MLRKLVQYGKGYLKIHVSGYFAERFLNGCSHKKIRLWDLKPVPGGYEMCITISGFRKLKPIIRKTGTKVVIVKRSGLPFLLFKYRKRRLFFAGSLLFVLLIFLMSRHIWSIEFCGNQSYTDDTLLKFLLTKDVHAGMAGSDVDCAGIAADIREAYHDIVWVSASVDGTRLKIRLKENDDRLLDDDKDKNEAPENTPAPTDLVADMDGTIRAITPREGVVLVQEGSEVKKGDLLVSGQVPVRNDQQEVTGYQYHQADAQILAEVSTSYQDEMDLFYIKKDYDLVKKREVFLQVGPWRLTFGSIRNSYDYWTMEGYEKELFGNMHFPWKVSYGSRTASPYHASREKYATERIRQVLSTRFERYKEDLEKKGVEIIENDVKIYTESETAVADGRLLILTPIGVSRPSQLLEVQTAEEENEAGE